MKAAAENEAFTEPAPLTEVGREMLPGFVKPKEVVEPLLGYKPLESEGAAAEKEEEDKSAMGYLSKGFFSIVGTAKQLGQKAKTKIEEAKLGEKFTHAKDAVTQSAVTAGAYVVDKTKVAAQAVKQKGTEIAESNAMKSFKEKASTGVTKAGSAIANVWIFL